MLESLKAGMPIIGEKSETSYQMIYGEIKAQYCVLSIDIIDNQQRNLFLRRSTTIMCDPKPQGMDKV